jgi:hypothetical protein
LLPGFMPDKWTIFGIIVIGLASFLNVRILLRGPGTHTNGVNGALSGSSVSEA